MEKIWEYTIKLLRYVLNSDIPELPEDIDFEQLFAFGESHGVENMLYVGLRDLKINVPPDTMAKFEEAHDMAIMIEATQALELESISEAFEKAGIDFVPLKGSVVKYLYPMPDYRQSGDIDILIREEDENRAQIIMIENGYEHLDKQHPLHREYKKQPYYYVEIHKQLVAGDNRAYPAFSDIWSLLKQSKPGSHRYVMDNELLYTFTIAHLCKHIHNNGAGIKFVMDIWQLLNKHTYGEQKLSDMLKRANIIDFEKWARELALCWFGKETTSDPTVCALGTFIIESGSFGNNNQHKQIRASVATKGFVAKVKYKLRCVWTNTFLPFRAMKKQYPFLDKYKFMYPITWGMRIVRIAVKEKKNLYNLAHSAAYVDESKSKPLQELWEAVKEI
ncbi:MAG: nucleotidyltransferase family protein [Clostridiales bacterium]|nr:nucleotidyltransferase family protein [Clostridiales bacterium]